MLFPEYKDRANRALFSKVLWQQFVDEVGHRRQGAGELCLCLRRGGIRRQRDGQRQEPIFFIGGDVRIMVVLMRRKVAQQVAYFLRLQGRQIVCIVLFRHFYLHSEAISYYNNR